MDHTENSIKSSGSPVTGPQEGSSQESPQQESLLQEGSLPENPLQEGPLQESFSQEASDDTLVAAMEAILFAMGDAVSIDMLARALQISTERAESVAGLLAEKCAKPSSGLALNRYEDAIQLSTRPDLLDYLIRIASEPKKPRLTPTLMETLSIIAFKQPVTRMEVENIRGVNSDFAINRLISFDLVREVGRKEVPGRPLLFGTTEQFLRSFGLSSVNDLPEPDTSRMEEFREEAEEEVNTGLNV